MTNTVKIFPASSNQQGVWFHSQKYGTSYWNLINIKSYKGDLDFSLLKEALFAVLIKHTALRTNFKLSGHQLNQVIRNASLENVFSHIVLNENSSDEIKRIVDAEIEAIRNTEFDYQYDSLIKFRVLQFGEIYVFVLLINHIITDVVSTQIFWEELAHCFNQKIKVVDIIEGPISRQYYDYSLYQSDFKSSVDSGIQKKYWLEKLSGQLPVLDLAFSKDGFSSKVEYEKIEISCQLKEDIRLLSLKRRVLFSSIFLCAYFILLFKHSKQSKILIGNVFNGRNAQFNKKNKVIGLFAKRLVNVLDLNENDSIADLIYKINSDLLDTLKNGDFSYEEIVRDKTVKATSNLMPIFQASFNMIKGSSNELEFNGLHKFESFESVINCESQFNIDLFIIETGEITRIGLKLKCIPRFKPMLKVLLANYEQILRLITYRSEITVSDVISNIPGDVFCISPTSSSSSKPTFKVSFDF
jgi:hypothetical protein